MSTKTLERAGSKSKGSVSTLLAEPAYHAKRQSPGGSEKHREGHRVFFARRQTYRVLSRERGPKAAGKKQRGLPSEVFGNTGETVVKEGEFAL